MSKSFSDRLTPGQVQHVYDALELPWREYYNPDNDGWCNIPTHALPCPDYCYNSDLSVNIQHGGFMDQYCNGHPDPMIDGNMYSRGDIVTLVAMLLFESSQETRKAIEWIKGVLGMGEGVKPPELKNGRMWAKDYKDNGDGKFVRLPKDLLRSDLTASEKLVWAAIFDRCGKNEIYSYPGMRRLSKDTGLAVGTVQKAIKHLVSYGLLIEKPRGTGKAPARFPLVAEESEINQSIMAHDKDTVSNSEHPRTKYRTPPVSNSELNYTHTTKPNKLNPNSYKSKPDGYRPDRSFWCTYSAEEEEALQAFGSSIGIAVDELPEPPAKYQELFIATFADTHTLNADGMYQLSDNMVFDPAAINSN